MKAYLEGNEKICLPSEMKEGQFAVVVNSNKNMWNEGTILFRPQSGNKSSSNPIQALGFGSSTLERADECLRVRILEKGEVVRIEI